MKMETSKSGFNFVFSKNIFFAAKKEKKKIYLYKVLCKIYIVFLLCNIFFFIFQLSPLSLSLSSQNYLYNFSILFAHSCSHSAHSLIFEMVGRGEDHEEEIENRRKSI